MFTQQQLGAPTSQPYCAAPNPFNFNYFSPNMQPQSEMEMEPEEGYLPPDPALYNFYSPEQQFMQLPQQPQPPHFTFLRRINKMNWDLIANVDVGTIAKTGDTASIEYLMQPIAFANITQDDMKQFGTRSALHAFLILQMAVEILLSKLNTSHAAQPPPQPQVAQAQASSQVAAQYEARINLLNKDIKARDMIISNLSDKLKFAEKAKDEAYQQLRTKIKNPSDSFIESHVPTKEKVKMTTVTDENNETGAVHFDTEYYEYLHQKPTLKIRRSSHHSSSSSSRHSDSRTHRSRRDGSELKKKKRKSESDESSEYS